MSQNNYIKKHEPELDIPEFLSARMDTTNILINKPENDFVIKESVNGINTALQEGNNIRTNNMYHMKELDKIAEAYSEEEAKVIVKRIVSNYPDIVLGEVASLIKDMQELSGSILKNSKIFATKRGEV